jgi:sialate O-acetylesterase
MLSRSTEETIRFAVEDKSLLCYIVDADYQPAVALSAVRRGGNHPFKHITTTHMNIFHSLPRATALCVTFSLFCFSASTISQQRVFSVAPVIADSMVLQQQSHVPLWGRGTPGADIRLQTTWGANAATKVNSDSTWMLKVHTPKAGGPHQLVIRHNDTTLTIKSVLVGEVWLCSGQSNMEMPLAGWPPADTILNAAEEIEHSLSPNIRLFAVRRAFSPVLESACDGSWRVCSPLTSREFSAAAYFFGKKLYETLQVPIGLIQSTWGGTPAESWISAQFLSRIPEYDTTLQKLRGSAEGWHRVLSWLDQYPIIDMRQRRGEGRWKELSFQDEGCPSRSYNDSEWRTMHLPTLWEATEVGNLDGVVWFRKQVTIPPDWVHKNLVLELGPIDDIDVTFVNGAKVGSHEKEGAWNVNRIYAVPGRINDSTLVQIAVRVIDFGGGGGIYGDPKLMSLHPEGSEQRVSLAGDWKYLPVAEYLRNALYVLGAKGNQYETRPRLPIDISANTPTALYNGMISPLIPYSIRGVIWYQGESNVGNPKLYKKLFPLLIENWRSDFRTGDFPFYYVQIAPYDYGSASRSQYLREAQTSALSVKNTGMAVTLDIGNPKNIHPANKQDVGERLALWALAKTYKRNVAYSGPIYKSMRKLKGSIELQFDHAEKGLVLTGSVQGNGFQIAGADRVFKAATVEVRGNKLIVSHPDIANPEAVRYAFSNTPDATLFNTDGLPAPSFRTDDWE